MCVNTSYGMTGGQYSGTTPAGSKPHVAAGARGDPFISARRRRAGAPYWARARCATGGAAAAHPNGLSRRGFSFIEALSICPTHYGRRTRADAVREYQKLATWTLPLEKKRVSEREERQESYSWARSRRAPEEWSSRYKQATKREASPFVRQMRAGGFALSFARVLAAKRRG